MIASSHQKSSRRATAALVILASTALPLCAATALAVNEIVTVTTLHDVTDFGGQQRVADLPGSDGKVSFREALTASNNTPGAQSIHFAIPTSEYWLFPDIALLRLEDGAFLISDDYTTVDFSTQATFVGDLNPDGGEVGIYGLEPNGWGVAAIFIGGDHCVVKGLDFVGQRGHGVSISGNHNRIIGCTISGPFHAGVTIDGGFFGPPATFNIIGGTEAGEGNRLSSGDHGVRIDAPAENNVVIGNTLSGSFSGVAIRGSQYTTTAKGNRIGGPTPGERNIISGAGHHGEEGFPVGEQVQLIYAENTLIEGNYIGTTADGSAPWPNQRGTAGVEVGQNCINTIIRDNLISGIAVDGFNHAAGQRFGVGINVAGNATGTIIVGNLIGTDASGADPLPNRSGVIASWFQGYPTSTILGGADPGDGNTVAFNETVGVGAHSGVTGMRILGNSIHSNGALGIDLLNSSGQPGVSFNDPGDGDTGGNNLQNFPVLASAVGDSIQITIVGTFHSHSGQQFLLEFFASAECDPSGHGEGARFLGSTTLTTDGAGNASFSAPLAAAVEDGEAITATATRAATGDSSEFSGCIIAEITPSSGTPGDLDADTDVDSTDLNILLSDFGCTGGACAGDADGDGDTDSIDLNIVLSNFGA